MDNHGIEMKSKSQKPHVVVVPYLGQGHLIPFLELSKLLASHGLTVSYVTTKGNVGRVQPELDNFKIHNPGSDVRIVALTMPSIEGVPPGVESTDNVPFYINAILMTNCHKLAVPFEEWLQGESSNEDNESRPVCIIGDLLTGWVHDSAAKFGIPTVVFRTWPALAMAVFDALEMYEPQKKVEKDDEYFQVPNLKFDCRLRKSDLNKQLRDPGTNPLHLFMKVQMKKSIETQGIILNTFYELEPQPVEHIKSLTGRPVWTVGPMLPATIFHANGIERSGSSSRGKASDISETELLKWMESRRPNSVVFVCLGSQMSPNKDQIRALAGGLEASGQAFLWAIRRVKGEEKCDLGLPEGFEERTKERGLVIWGWAPQLVILSHPCVGAFLSHCGWNSTLESVTLGVPMITWPMFAEQPFNSKLLEDYLGIGVPICVDISSVPDEEKVKEAVIRLLVEEEGEEMRRRAQELRNKAKIAVGEGGSSQSSLKNFVKYVTELHENEKWVKVNHSSE